MKARAGKLSAAWTETSLPGEAEIEVLLDQTADEIDGLLSGRGYDLPIDVVAAESLRGLNADMALVLLILGTWPGDRSVGGVQQALDDAIARRDASWTSLVNGTHPAIIALEGGPGQAGASDFWTNEPEYGKQGVPPKDSLNPFLAPTAERGMDF